MIVEIAGRPADHVKEILSKHVGVMNNIKDLVVHSIKVHDPKEIEGSNGVYTCFAEVEFEAPSLGRLGETVFDFMPSSIEIVEPSRISADLPEVTALLNSISGKLHRYDEIAKIAQFKIHQLTAQLEAAQKAPVKEEKPKQTKKKASKKKKK
jgi:hypothetical protein